MASRTGVGRLLPRYAVSAADCATAGLLAVGADRKVPEMRDGPRVQPKGDRTLAARPGLDVVDDQRGLWVAVDVEARPLATHLDPHLRPFAGHEIDIRLVPGRRLLAQPEPGPVGMGDVLGGMIAALLVLRAAVGATQVERVVGLSVVLQPEGDADESAGSLGRVGRGNTR